MVAVWEGRGRVEFWWKWEEGGKKGRRGGGGIVDDWMALSQHSKMGTFRVLFDRYEVWR